MFNFFGFKFLSQQFLTLIAIWSLVWKGLALWRAARKNSKYWFVAILIINTLGLLEIIYLVFFSKRGERSQQLTVNPSTRRVNSKLENTEIEKPEARTKRKRKK